MIDLEKLEALAKAATPGPWAIYDGFPLAGSHGTHCGAARIGTDTADVLHGDDGGDIYARTDDFEFIATADPQTVLALLAEIRDLRTRLDYHRRLSDQLAGGAP